MQPIYFSHMYTTKFHMPSLTLALVLLVSLASPISSCTEQDKSSFLGSHGTVASRRRGRATPTAAHGKGSPATKTGRSPIFRCLLEDLRGPSHHSLVSGLLRLNLSGNLLSGGLPPELVQSSSITVLDVSFNPLTGGLSELPSSTPGRPLQVLNISSNLFTGRFPSTTWEVMKSLVVLNASTNSFTGQIPIMPCVSAPSFAVLELSFNQFSGNIPQGLSNCSVLKLLAAGYNNLSGTLPEDLFNVTSLEHLSLPSNWLEGPLSGISKLTNLVALDLGELTSGELTKLNFSSLTKLKKLDLLNNRFTGTIPESIYSCSRLTALRLSHNNFHGQLSERIGNLKSLSFLSLVNISLTNITGTLQILGKSRSITTLLIGVNFMHETMPEDDSIDGFENLQVLSMNDCSLSGKIPHWLSKLTNLGLLVLCNNQLNGPIPLWISSLKVLFYLDVSNNSLMGEIPTVLMEMPMWKSDKTAPKVFFELPIYAFDPSLQYLMLSAYPKLLNLGINNLTGLIPEKIGQLNALTSLNLGSNKLAGEIPEPICTLTNLQVLDLSNNHLTGRIPAALNNLNFLSNFSISNNNLEGPIPTTGQLSTFPGSSFEGNPKLCGPMIVNHCGSTESGPVSIVSTKEIGTEVFFAIAFGAFFVVGVLYDQIVLARHFG